MEIYDQFIQRHAAAHADSAGEITFTIFNAKRFYVGNTVFDIGRHGKYRGRLD